MNRPSSRSSSMNLVAIKISTIDWITFSIWQKVLWRCSLLSLWIQTMVSYLQTIKTLLSNKELKLCTEMLALLAQVPVAENKCLTTFGSMDLTPIMKTECLMAQITITSTTRCMITLPMILASRICQSIIPRAILVVPLPMVLAILILSGIKSYNWSEVKETFKYFGQIQLLQTSQLH